jgi:hypothetical protein
MDRSESASGIGALDEILEHYGIKGMKWGIHKSRSSSASSPTTSHPASSDAVKADAAKAKIGKKGNTRALSNQELQHLVTRMNLERQYSSLSSMSKPQSAGAKFAKEIILGVGKQQLIKLANDQAAKQIAKAMVKK